MESEFLLNLEKFSIELIIISIIVFALTMLVKWPIKKATANLEENKRKAVNTVIVFIPMILSFVFSLLYNGTINNQWFNNNTYEMTAGAYILSVTIYAIYSRIIILIKGTKKTITSENETDNADFSKETINYVKNNIKSISKALKLDKNNLETIVLKIEKLLSIKSEITNNTSYQDIVLTENLDKQLVELESQRVALTNSISSKEKEIDNFENTLKK